VILKHDILGILIWEEGYTERHREERRDTGEEKVWSEEFSAERRAQSVERRA